MATGQTVLRTNPVDESTGKSSIKHSKGTSVFSGFFQEEYLSDLRGTRGSEKYDRMRRNDSQVRMIVNAVLNPLRSAQYSIAPATEDDQDPFAEAAKLHADFVQFQLFEDLATSWQMLLNEVLTFPVFGFAPFVKVHKSVKGNPRFGNYTGLHDLVFVSQKSVYSWQLNEYGNLIAIDQQISGDLSNFGKIPAEFLVLFVNEQEGANYEGFSILRSAYGSWWRKNQYLKIEGIGLERSALGIPIMKVPAGKESDAERSRAELTLEALAAHQQQWIMQPEGWDLDIYKIDFSAEAIRAAIDKEDQAMARSIMANFLNLGQGGAGGAYSLSADLSDFFIAGNEYLANIVTSVFNKHVIPEIVALTYGPQPAYPKMIVSGLAEKAGKEFAEIIQIMKTSGAFGVWSKQDAAHARKRFKWIGENETDPAGGQSTPAPVVKPQAPENEEPEELETMHRRPEKTVKLSAPKAAFDLIDQASVSLTDLMKTNTRYIAEKLSADLISTWEKLPEGQKPSAPQKVQAGGLVQYKTQLRNALLILATKALNQVASENPKIKTTKFADPADLGGTPKKSQVKKLPKRVKASIENQAQLIVDSQAADIEKAIFFSFGSVEPTTDSARMIEQELGITIDGLLVKVQAGAAVTAAKLVNETRHEFFFDPEVFEQIESFTFFNEDPVTEICTYLNGRVFRKDDAESWLYEPPLHYNCKSILIANDEGSGTYAATPKNRQGIVPTKTLQAQVKLHDKNCCNLDSTDGIFSRHWFIGENKND